MDGFGAINLKYSAVGPLTAMMSHNDYNVVVTIKYCDTLSAYTHSIANTDGVFLYFP